MRARSGWPLRCAAGDPDCDGQVGWQPTPREPDTSFARFADVHPSILEYFASYWWCRVGAYVEDEPIYLRSFENELRQIEELASWPAQIESGSVCIANFGDDRFIAADVHDGSVAVQDFGREPCVLAPSIAAWLDALRPWAV